MATIKFLLQSNSKNAQIYVRFRSGRAFDLKAKTGFCIDYDLWNEKIGYPKTGLKDEINKKKCSSIQSNLKDFESRLDKAFNDCTNKILIDKQWLNDFINPPQQATEITDKLIPFIDYYNEIKAKDIKSGTLKRNKSTRNLILKFQTDNKADFLIKDIDTNFILKFEQYCIKQKYALNYVARAVKYLKTICFNARVNDIEISSKVDLIKPKMEKVDKIYLTTEELETISKKVFDTESLDNARDWLLISCETGQRVSDFMRFTKEMIRHENKKALIEFTQVKTNKIMTVPLSKKVLKILKKRGGNFPYSISDQKYNDYIKDVCKLAEINEKVKGSIIEVTKKEKRKKSGTYEKWELVSSHIGRRSFATNNYGKIPTSLLISATGHSTEKMFLEYIGKSDTQKALQLAEYF